MSTKPDLSRLLPRLQLGLDQLQLTLDATAQQRLIHYLELLAFWNQAYNLSAIRDPDEMLSKHLFDSLAMAPHWHTDAIADMGAGAGLPGIPLAIVYPERRVFVIESNGKKARFMRECQRQLGLTGLQVEERRAEAFRPNIKVPSATARALAVLSQLCDWCRPWLAEDGELLAMKGPAFEAELNDLPQDFRHDQTWTLAVPELDGERYLVRLVRT